MTLFRDQIERAIVPLLGVGFTVAEVVEVPNSFGNTKVVLTSRGLRLRFISDRGQIFVDVAHGDAAGWYDLSEVLAKCGQRSAAGPWDTPDVAVAEFQRNEAVVVRLLADDAWIGQLKARP